MKFLVSWLMPVKGGTSGGIGECGVVGIVKICKGRVVGLAIVIEPRWVGGGEVVKMSIRSYN